MDLGRKEAKIGIILIVIGIIFILNNFDVFDFTETLLKLSPILLVWWGLHLLRKRGRVTHKEGDFQVFGDTVTTTSSPFVKNSSAFGDISIKITSEEFSGGSVSSIFGKVSIDLEEVERIGSYGQLDLHTVFGDITLRVPDGIAVEVSGTTLFGSIIAPNGEKAGGNSYRSPGFETSDNRLFIRTSLVFGDIELI